MTTLARPWPSEETPARAGAETIFDLILLEAFRGLHGARGMSVTDLASGILVYLVLEDLRVEDEAFERMIEARARLGGPPIELRCVTFADAERLTISESARQYPLA